ncbi:MAG: hypothetical protein ACYTG1_02900 [Planctomycetota bacterium]|jgi:hypothetical protein
MSSLPSARRAVDRPLLEELDRRLDALERLVHAIEDELSDDSIDDEQKLQNIGERVASFTDGT